MLRGDFSISHKIPSIISDFSGCKVCLATIYLKLFFHIYSLEKFLKLPISLILPNKSQWLMAKSLKKKSWPISHDFFYLFSPKSVCCFSTSFNRSAFLALASRSRSRSASLFAEAAENDESELVGSRVASFAL